MIYLFLEIAFFVEFTLKNQNFQNFPSFLLSPSAKSSPQKTTAYEPQLFVKKITFSCNVGTFFLNSLFCQRGDHLYDNFFKWQ